MFIDNLIFSFACHSIKLEDIAKDFADAEFVLHIIKIVKKYFKLTKFFRWLLECKYKKNITREVLQRSSWNS